jgi:hypothetical protein
MSTTAVGHCSHCAAVVNRQWRSCLVCHTALPAPSREARSPVSAVQPGNRLTWQGSDGKTHDGLVDFLHNYPGEVWAFCSLPDGGWTAVNVKYIRKVAASL